MDFVRLINLAVQKGGQQGLYNWPRQVRDVYKDVYGSEARAGGQYGNSFQAGLSSLLPAGDITNLMADALNLSQAEGISVGEAAVRMISNRQDSVLTNTDADLMKMKSIGDYLNGNISKDDAQNIRSYVSNLSRLKDTTSAASGAQQEINNLERDIQRTQEQYQNSSLGMASTKDTYEPRLASLNSQLEEARADLIVKQGRLNETTGKFNTAYNSVANLNTSMGIYPAGQAASVFSGGTTSDFQAGQQGMINQTQAAQQAATSTTAQNTNTGLAGDAGTYIGDAATTGGEYALLPQTALGGLSSSPPYSDETVSRVTALLNSGEVDVNQVSSHFNVPIPSIIQGLTGISRDAYTSGDDIANADVNAVMKMINSGVASIADVADYFSSDPSIIENYLTDVELYSAEDLANARQGVAVASAGVRNIAADGDYTEAEIQMVTDSINNGLLSTAQVAQQFGLSEDEVIAYMANQNNNQNTNQNNNQNNNQNTNQNTNQNNNQNNNQGNNQNNNQGNNQNNNQGLFSGNNTAEDQARARELGMTPLEYAQAGGLGADTDQTAIQAAIQAGGLNTTYNTGAEIPTGLRGSEMALQGGAAGAIQMLDQINQSGRADLTSRYNAGLTAAEEGAAAAQGFISPYQEAGTTALQQQLALSGALGQDAFDTAYQESPQMAFLREQGMRANLAGAGATGGLGGGNVQKELQRFGQGLASQGLQNQIGNLQQIASQGYNAGRDLSNISTGLGTQQLTAQQNLGNQLAQSGLSTGLPAASTITALGNNLALGRTRVGEQLAGQYGDASNYLANTYSQQGSNIAGLIGNQANSINAQREAAANNAARGQVGYGTALGGIQSNMGSNISGVPNTPIAQPNYANAIGNALGAGGFAYDMFQPNQNQFQTQQQANYAFGSGGNPAMINASQPNPYTVLG